MRTTFPPRAMHRRPRPRFNPHRSRLQRGSRTLQMLNGIRCLLRSRICLPLGSQVTIIEIFPIVHLWCINLPVGSPAPAPMILRSLQLPWMASCSTRLPPWLLPSLLRHLPSLQMLAYHKRLPQPWHRCHGRFLHHGSLWLSMECLLSLPRFHSMLLYRPSALQWLVLRTNPSHRQVASIRLSPFHILPCSLMVGCRISWEIRNHGDALGRFSAPAQTRWAVPHENI